jgi:hypothetical protein
MPSKEAAPDQQRERVKTLTKHPSQVLSRGDLILGHGDRSAGLADDDANEEFDKMSPVFKCFAQFLDFLKYVPVINFMWHSFLQTTLREDVRMINPDSVREIANLIGLVAALLFTILTAMPTGLTWDEFETVDRHWQGPSLDQFKNFKDFEIQVKWSKESGQWQSETTSDIIIGKYGCQYDKQYFGQPMSTRIGNTIGQGTTWLALDIILSMILIVSVSTLARVDLAGDRKIKFQEDANREGVEVPETAMKNWWVIGRWVVIFMCLALVWGVVLTNRMLNDVFYVKWPQPWLVTKCKAAGWTEVLVDGCTDSSDPDCFATFSTQSEIKAVQYSGGHFVRCSVFDRRIFHSRMLLDTMPVGLKQHACDPTTSK